MMQSSNVNSMSVNQAAFYTIAGLGIGTIGAACAAAVTASTVATVAFALLSVAGATVSLAAIAAYMDTNSTTSEQYFKNLQKYIGPFTAGMIQFTAQILVQAIIERAIQEVVNAIFGRRN